jgi:hypothetical protein
MYTVSGIQWLVSAPPDVASLQVEDVVGEGEGGRLMEFCSTMFKQQLLGLLYVVFLIIVVVLLAFKSRGVRENYRYIDFKLNYSRFQKYKLSYVQNAPNK